jgi:hypothetical protein
VKVGLVTIQLSPHRNRLLNMYPVHCSKNKTSISNTLNEFSKSQRLREDWARVEHAVCGGLGLSYPQPVFANATVFIR